MNDTALRSMKTSRETCVFALPILPAILLGLWAMIQGGVSPVLWGQQAAAFALCLLTVRPMRRIAKRAPDAALAVVLLVFLAASLLGAGAGGARRWVDLGVFNVNAAMLVLPALLILLSRMERPEWLLCASAVLCVQPDFSQLAALTAASVPLLWRGKKARGRMLFLMAVQIVLAALCLGRPVVIEPVAYCEGVLEMLGAQSGVLLAAGAAALALIPGWWIFRFRMKKSAWMLSLAGYYALTILLSLSGEYPVPFMGFGLSPILGCWLACAVMNDV